MTDRTAVLEELAKVSSTLDQLRREFGDGTPEFAAYSQAYTFQYRALSSQLAELEKPAADIWLRPSGDDDCPGFVGGSKA